MKAIKYKISISEKTIAHECLKEIEEIAIDYLGAVINYSGVHFPSKFEERVTSGKDAEEIDISTDILDYVEEIRKIKDIEKEIVSKLNLK
jgi:hydrogenase maturation factor HypE